MQLTLQDFFLNQVVKPFLEDFATGAAYRAGEKLTDLAVERIREWETEIESYFVEQTEEEMVWR